MDKKEYIEREALIKDFELMASVQPEYKQSTILGMVSTIKNRKAADVAPVVHGRWVSNGISESILSGCSVCDFTCGAYSFNYCPNCGAKMDGGKE